MWWKHDEQRPEHLLRRAHAAQRTPVNSALLLWYGGCTKVALEDLRKMRLELHLLITGTQKGSKASSRGGNSEEACEIVSLVLQRHRDDLGEAEEISVEELLPGEEARKVGNSNDHKMAAAVEAV